MISTLNKTLLMAMVLLFMLAFMFVASFGCSHSPVAPPEQTLPWVGTYSGTARLDYMSEQKLCGASLSVMQMEQLYMTPLQLDNPCHFAITAGQGNFTVDEHGRIDSPTFTGTGQDAECGFYFYQFGGYFAGNELRLYATFNYPKPCSSFALTATLVRQEAQ